MNSTFPLPSASPLPSPSPSPPLPLSPSPSPSLPCAPPAPTGSNVTEPQAQTPDTTGPPIQRPVPVATPHPTPPRPISMPHYGAPGGGYSPMEGRQPYQPHPSMSTGQHSYPGQPGMVGGASATYPGQVRLAQWARTGPSSEWCVCVCACVRISPYVRPYK